MSKKKKKQNNELKPEKDAPAEEIEIKLETESAESDQKDAPEEEVPSTPDAPVPPPPLPSEEAETEKPHPLLNQYHSLEGKPAIGSTFDALLKSPGTILFELKEGNSRAVAINLVIAAIGCLAVFGGIIGFFSGGMQAWAAPLKVVMGMLASCLITLPSLYIFGCLNGMDLSLRNAAALLLTSVALMGLLLVGFAPVSWIFTQSTDSVGFIGFLTLVFWLISLGFGLNLIFRAAAMMGIHRKGHLVIWALIFILVTLQMSTALRPIIGPSEKTFLPVEKKFFLAHWKDALFEDEWE